ncbi:serine hydrolase [Anderseniella sp. Alg231-50]|uniref:serine hydrolase n=1 Tax=Anderseniella sp. Alg231-50 TaxID=1922226 RepID=UPI000D5582DB
MPLQTSSPAQCGLDAARLTRIDDWMQRYVDGGRFPFAATLIARKGRVAWEGHTGYSDVEAKTAYTPDTLARMYSMTKPVTSTAFMMLYEQGLVHLDDPVSMFIPEFADTKVLVSGAESLDQTEPLHAPMTVHNLLTHTSGLTYGFNQDLLSETYGANRLDFGQRAGGLAETAVRLAETPLLFQPGSRWHYSVATDVVGRIVEVVSGKTLDRFFADNILEPLEMHDTSFVVPSSKMGRLGPCYAYDPEGGMPVFPTGFGEGEVDTMSGGGGLISTGRDYLRFAEMLRRGGALGDVRLLSRHTLSLMTSNHLPGGVDLATLGPSAWCETSFSGVGFGLGFAISLNPAQSMLSASAGDFSWGGMASTYFWCDPKEELSVVFLTQLLPSSTWPSRKELRALVYQAIVD